MKYIKILLCVITFSSLVACKKYLDIVPDNVPTLDYAFRMRSTAEQYLFTCYSFLPQLGNQYVNPAFAGADEIWVSNDKTWGNFRIARGEQNINNPILGSWDDLWMAISQCNVFLDNIDKVPDMEEHEKWRWIGEVKFLKAYYYFYLLRAYGPIPIIKENLPIAASGEEVRVYRKPVEEVFEYIIELIDESLLVLPERLYNEGSEYGRISLPIALGYKAKILVYAASPLFNGNNDYLNFVNEDGVEFFNSEEDSEKWQRAVDAAEEAIILAHSLNYQLYNFEFTQQTSAISDETRIQMNNRGTLTERWNDEIIWANTNSTTATLQAWSQPKALAANQTLNTSPNGSIGVPLKMASLFYTENGVPIEEDHTWNYNTRFALRQATSEDKYSIKEGQVTAEFNFDRESRFYGSLGFDRGIWYGQGKYDDNDPYWLQLKKGEFGGKTQVGWHSVTGYYAKKLVHYTNANTSSSAYVTTNYPWVMLRLGDLYLLYAEALNELNGPSNLVYEYLNRIRTKAGLPGVLEAWSGFSNNPTKPQTKEGLREIIQRERAIEMAFEGERFWDLRRWKTAPEELNQSITGWDVNQETIDGFYRETFLFDQVFGLKDYFWPIREHDLIVNKNLVQNPGW